jgi:hypothetical protein
VTSVTSMPAHASKRTVTGRRCLAFLLRFIKRSNLPGLSEKANAPNSLASEGTSTFSPLYLPTLRDKQAHLLRFADHNSPDRCRKKPARATGGRTRASD